MKKVLICLLCVLVGLCGCKKQEELDDLTERIVKKTVSELKKRGYSRKDKCVLEVPYEYEDLSGSYVVYEIKIKGKIEYYVTAMVVDEVPIGCIFYEYGAKYVCLILSPF